MQGKLALKTDTGEQGPARLVARAKGFSLQAARHLNALDRAGLAFLARYDLRAPLSLARLHELPSGKVLLALKRPLADGPGHPVLGLPDEPIPGPPALDTRNLAWQRPCPSRSRDGVLRARRFLGAVPRSM